MLTCGAKGNEAQQSANTKLFLGTVQNNSRTKYAGVNHSCKYPGMYRSRISVFNHRITKDGLSFHDAIVTRMAWEKMKKVIILANENLVHEEQREQ